MRCCLLHARMAAQAGFWLLTFCRSHAEDKGYRRQAHLCEAVAAGM